MRKIKDVDEADLYLSLGKEFYRSGRSAIWADQYFSERFGKYAPLYAIKKNDTGSASYTFDPMADSIEAMAKRTIIW